MDKERKDLLIAIFITITTTLIMGCIVFSVVPEVNYQIAITRTSNTPFDIGNAIIRILPIAVIGSLIMISLYYTRCYGGHDGI